MGLVSCAYCRNDSLKATCIDPNCTVPSLLHKHSSETTRLSSTIRKDNRYRLISKLLHYCTMPLRSHFSDFPYQLDIDADEVQAVVVDEWVESESESNETWFSESTFENVQEEHVDSQDSAVQTESTGFEDVLIASETVDMDYAQLVTRCAIVLAIVELACSFRKGTKSKNGKQHKAENTRLKSPTVDVTEIVPSEVPSGSMDEDEDAGCGLSMCFCLPCLRSKSHESASNASGLRIDASSDCMCFRRFGFHSMCRSARGVGTSACWGAEITARVATTAMRSSFEIVIRPFAYVRRASRMTGW